ncbi:Vacuolar protein sorting-associated protein 17 [Coemansia sp. Benny D115]|nr:Vacuolar protein sorting-associated protein 17 [Coemansia sp. Benny D115]
MYSAEEIDPHREGPPFGNPFAESSDAEGGAGSGNVTESDNSDSEDQPLALASPKASTASTGPTTPPPTLVFTVSQLVDRSKRTPVYTFDVTTNMPRFKARKYTGVVRSQLELERLEVHLQATYPECLVPTLPPGTTTSKYVADYQNDRLVVHLLQQWLARVCGHPILRQDYELRQFVEAPFAFNPAISSAPPLTMAPSAPSGSGFFSWGRTRTPQRRSSTSVASGASEFEQLLDTTAANLDVFQNTASDVRRRHGRLARTRARLAVDLRDVGTKLVSVGVIDHSVQLARAFKRLGKTMLHAGPSAQTLANAEGSRTWAVLGLLAASCSDVQRTLQSRQLIFTEHQVAERQLERKKQAAAVLRASSNINSEHAHDAVQELATARADAESKRLRAERVDRVLAADLRAFERYREADMRAMFAALAREYLTVERSVLAEQKAALEFVRRAAHARTDSA